MTSQTRCLCEPSLTPKSTLLVPHRARSVLSPPDPSFSPPLVLLPCSPCPSGEGGLTIGQRAGPFIGATVSLWLGVSPPLAVPEWRGLPGGRP